MGEALTNIDFVYLIDLAIRYVGSQKKKEFNYGLSKIYT